MPGFFFTMYLNQIKRVDDLWPSQSNLGRAVLECSLIVFVFMRFLDAPQHPIRCSDRRSEQGDR